MRLAIILLCLFLYGCDRNYDQNEILDGSISTECKVNMRDYKEYRTSQMDNDNSSNYTRDYKADFLDFRFKSNPSSFKNEFTLQL